MQLHLQIVILVALVSVKSIESKHHRGWYRAEDQTKDGSRTSRVGGGGGGVSQLDR